MQLSPKLITSLIIAGSLALLAYMSTFVVTPYNQVIVIKFGEPKRVIKEPGLHLKIPFIEDLVYYEKRALPLDNPPKEIIMSDKSRIVVDTYTLYRIVDPLLFYRKARSLKTANMLLTEQLSADLNKTIAKVNFEIMLSERRAEVMTEVMGEMSDSAKDLGVEIVDIRIRRADVPQQISKSIYDRMISERERIANQIRARGRELAQTIRAEADRQATVIIADARRDAEKLKGEGDGAAAQIYASAYGKNPKFYMFYRQLKAYEAAMVDTTQKPTIVVDPAKFRFLESFHKG